MNNRIRTKDAFWRSARILVSEWSLKWYNFMFTEIQLVCDGQAEGRTDAPSYRNPRTHLKSKSDDDIKSFFNGDDGQILNGET